jgi:hypothetical protein
MTIQLGYCTNVHAGADLYQTRANLSRFAVAVRQRFCPEAPLGIGLWLSASSARELLEDDRLEEFRDWLNISGLLPFTFNGFPYGDFHQRVVKHQVYLPTWAEPDRWTYTDNLITIQDRLLPPGLEASLSTLPLAWGQPPLTPSQRTLCADALRRIADRLARLEADSGRRVTLCLEAEPGCELQYSRDIVLFFEEDLLRGHDERPIRRHLGVCHDVCHAAVMFEDQTEVLNRYRSAGLRVGKVQVSSAVRLPAETLASANRAAALLQLASFNEDRYLHQTVVRANEAATFHEDLSHALRDAERHAAVGEWRVHFHVPVYLERFGHLEAMQEAIHDCLGWAAKHGLTNHYEVETYAWSVLPAELQQPDLSAGIAAEMAWFDQTIRAAGIM